MNGNSNILARLRCRKARGALYAAVMLVAAQLSAALTPCFANVADGDAHAHHGVSAGTPHGADAGGDARHTDDVDHADHVDHAGHAHAAQVVVASHASDGSHADHSSHVTHTAHAGHASHAGDADDRQHCPHCTGAPPDAGAAHVGQDHDCAAVETVDTAPQPPLELAPKLLYLAAIPVAIERPIYIPARASPRNEAPRVPSAVPLNLRHCVFLI